MTDETQGKPFTLRVVAGLPEKKSKTSKSKYEPIAEFVRAAGGRWCVVSEEEKYANVASYLDRCCKDLERAVRGGVLYCRVKPATEDSPAE